VNPRSDIGAHISKSITHEPCLLGTEPTNRNYQDRRPRIEICAAPRHRNRVRRPQAKIIKTDCGAHEAKSSGAEQMHRPRQAAFLLVVYLSHTIVEDYACMVVYCRIFLFLKFV
jgi:hypothetical protein